MMKSTFRNHLIALHNYFTYFSRGSGRNSAKTRKRDLDNYNVVETSAFFVLEDYDFMIHCALLI